MPSTGPLAAIPLASVGSGYTAASLTITGATPATTYVVVTYFVPTYVAAGSIGSSGGVTTVAVPYPASGIANGNFAVIQASVHTNTGSAVITAPAGWTVLIQAAPDTSLSHGMFYRVLDGTESGSVTLTSTPGALGSFVGVMHIWTNVDATTPFEGKVTGSFNSGHVGSTQSMTGGSVTSLGVNRKFVNFYTVEDAGGGPISSPTPGAGWTDDLNSFAHYSSFTDNGFVVDEDATIAPLPTTHAAESRTQTGQTYAFVSLALIPATTRNTSFTPSAATLSITGSANNATANATVTIVPAALSLSGVRAFAPAPANLVIFGDTPTVIFPGGDDDVVVAYVGINVLDAVGPRG